MPNYPERPTSAAAPLSAHARIERISEPWALSRTIAVAVTLVLAMVFGSWIANGEFEYLILFAVWAAAVWIIIFVQDYWWSPMLIIMALGLGTTAAGTPLSGMEVGVVILALTFPVKIAMKTLRKAEPEMSPGFFYWVVLCFVALHFVIILIYNKIDGAPQLRNIVKSYYTFLTPLVFYGLLVRYCRLRTVRPTIDILFFTNLFVVAASIITLLAGISIPPLTGLHIGIGWLDFYGAMGTLRNGGPLLFAGAVAFWPVVRTAAGRSWLGAAIVIALFGTLVGSGRISVFCCIFSGASFAILRGKLWLALPVLLCTLLTSVLISASPDFYLGLPSLIQRSLAPLNFSVAGEEQNENLEGSNGWHKELRDRSFDYWTEDTTSFWLGHGFKSWDPTIDPSNQDAVDPEHMVELAIEMGATENMFSSITNIFGVAGLVVYGCFLGSVIVSLIKVCRLAPVGSDARALCEFSLVNLIPSIFLAFYAGTIPGPLLFFWTVGILAARPYLAERKPAKAPAPERPAFARPAYAGQMPRLQPRRFRPGSA
jgi:hypothetical protein